MTSDKEDLLSYDLAVKLFSYHEDGYLLWNQPRNKTKKPGQRVGGRRKDGRQQVMLNFDGKNYLYLVYRIIWLLHNERWPGKTIDHIDGDSRNDRIENLRDISQKGNNENRICCLKTSSTGVLGVHRHNSGRYRANIGVSDTSGNTKQLYLGLFDNINEAEMAYLRAKEEHHKML